MNINEMKDVLQKSLPAKRYCHSVAVYETALKLAEVHKLPLEKIAVAALLHDCGREGRPAEDLLLARGLGIELDAIEEAQPVLIHAKLGVYNARRKYGVEDKEILEGILFHTTGAPGMSVLAVVVYLADMLEPGRNFPGIEELRELARQDLDKALLASYIHTIAFLTGKGQLIHPNCVDAYNELLMTRKEMTVKGAADGRK